MASMNQFKIIRHNWCITLKYLEAIDFGVRSEGAGGGHTHVLHVCSYIALIFNRKEDRSRGGGGADGNGGGAMWTRTRYGYVITLCFHTLMSLDQTGTKWLIYCVCVCVCVWVCVSERERERERERVTHSSRCSAPEYSCESIELLSMMLWRNSSRSCLSSLSDSKS